MFAMRSIARSNGSIRISADWTSFSKNRISASRFWKTAGRELGHRRFFDVNTLVGLRTEELQVFDDTHRLLIDWLSEA